MRVVMSNVFLRWMELACHSIDRLKLVLDGKGVMKTNYQGSAFRTRILSFCTKKKTAINVKNPKEQKSKKLTEIMNTWSEKKKYVSQSRAL